MEVQMMKVKAAELRLRILETALRAGKGHVAPAFSWVEIAVALFHAGILRIDPQNPTWPNRDRFILSKGHACLTLYGVLADLGFLQQGALESFCQDGSLLAGHPDPNIPGVETVSGSLGHGLGVGAGLALGSRLDREDWMVFVLLGDGECDEGSIWEAAMFAGHHQLNNLVAIVDRNRLSATDFTENVLALEPLERRWEAFGWDVVSVNGHSFEEIMDTFAQVRDRSSAKPLAVMAHTIKGKGVSFMEGSPSWHHRLPKGEEVTLGLQQLRLVLKEAEGRMVGEVCDAR